MHPYFPYEYKVISVDPHINIEETLNKLVEDRWELDVYANGSLILKRVKF